MTKEKLTTKMSLIIILLIFQCPNVKGEGKLSPMKISPNKCVVSKAGEPCLSQINFYIDLVQIGKFCVYRLGDYISLFCFEALGEEIQIQKELEITKDTKFVLVNEQLKTIVADTEFSLLVYKPIEINKRPKRVWGIL